MNPTAVLFAFLAGAATLAACKQVDGRRQVRDPDAYTDVSIVQLIATPERFNGQSVRVIGFCWLEFEGNALYLHRQDFEHALTNNGVWLSLGWPVDSKYAALSGKYVIVEATFSATQRGHMGMFSGSLMNITRLEEWPGRSEVPVPPPPPGSASHNLAQGAEPRRADAMRSAVGSRKRITMSATPVPNVGRI